MEGPQLTATHSPLTSLTEVIQITDTIYVKFHGYMTFRDNHVCFVSFANTFFPIMQPEKILVLF